MNNLNKIIVLCGSICSGKTYTANLISKETGFPVASFGGYLKHYCKLNNIPITRKNLQDIGEHFVETRPKEFLDDVINYYVGESDTLIIEGVRHISIFHFINKLAKNRITIYVEADQKTRYERYINRIKESDDFITFDKFLLLDKHPVELEIQSLKTRCGVVIDSTKPVDESLFKSFVL